MHLRGAQKLRLHRRDEGTRLVSVPLERVRPDGQRAPVVDDELDLLFKSLELQLSSFMWSSSPSLQLSRTPGFGYVFSDLHSGRINLMEICNRCVTWIATVFRLKISPARQTSQLCIQQGRHIASLSLWLEQFNARVMPMECQGTDPASKVLEHCLVLRMTCTSMLIRISNILDAQEGSYDVRASRFQQIFLDAERVLSVRDVRRLKTDKQLSQYGSILGPGIIEPLFQAAQNYREPFWRRRSIACLLRSGLELPFNGPREAAIAQRIMQYEEEVSGGMPTLQEARLPVTASCHGFPVHSVCSPSLATRINGC